MDAATGHILEANGRLCTWLRRTPEELCALTFAELLPMGQRLFWANKQLVGAYVDGEAAEVMYDLARGDGATLTALVTAEAIDDARHVYLVSRAERRKRYEEQLRAAKRQAEDAARFRRDFVNTVSHEIRTPIHAITNLVSFLDPDVEGASDAAAAALDQREIVEELRTSTTYLLRLVNDVLDLAKAEEGKIVLRPEPTDVTAVCEAAAQALAPTANAKGLRLEVRSGLASAARYVLDASKLRQVLLNLLGNGVKFTEEGGVTLVVEEVPPAAAGGVGEAGVDAVEGDAVAGEVVLRFRVSDTGPGVSEWDATRIFEPFEQTGKQAGATGSTGLGLAISRRLVETFGGTLTLESVVGEGSTFAFDVPARKEAAAADRPADAPAPIVSTWAPTPAATPADPLARMRVLHADDNATNRFIARRHLRRLDVDLTEVADGVEATAAAAAADFDVILLDIRMPNMDGPAAAAAIRTFPHHRRTPIYALSAGSTSRDGERIGEPFAGLLRKPYTAAGLRDVLLRALDARAADVIDLAALREGVFGSEVDDTELRAFLTIVRDDLRGHREQIVAAVREGEDAIVDELHHKLQTPVRALRPRGLEVALDAARAGGVTAEARQRLALSLDAAFAQVIEALGAELA